MRASLLLGMMTLLPAGALAADDPVEPAPRFGFGVALGLQPSPRGVCQQNGGDTISCVSFLPTWAMRLHASHLVAPGWSLALVGGAGTDLDATERVSSSGGRGTDVRRFFDLAVGARHLFGQGAGSIWLGVEGGLMLAVDSTTDFDAAGREQASGSAAQWAPLVGFGGGLALYRQGPFALDLQAGTRLSAFGHDPPDVVSGASPVDVRRATDYGTRLWFWLGLGGRYGN